jgi:hypothetical protein
MKRFFASLCALMAGLLLTWLCLYTLSHAGFPPPKAGKGCDAEHCGPWWALSLGLVVYLVPTIGCGVAGYLAAARGWPLRKTVVVFGLLAISAFILMVRPYVL